MPASSEDAGERLEPRSAFVDFGETITVFRSFLEIHNLRPRREEQVLARIDYSGGNRPCRSRQGCR